MPNIEVEVRSFIKKEQFANLMAFFEENARQAKDEFQETYYFRHSELPSVLDMDLRMQKSPGRAKIWLKKGKIHDFYREEIEVNIQREDFEKLEKLLNAMGFEAKIKWFRHRTQFDWNGIKVCLDFTKGYGYIIELERVCEDYDKERVLDILKRKMAELGISITPREEFERSFENYEKNWKELTGEK